MPLVMPTKLGSHAFPAIDQAIDRASARREDERPEPPVPMSQPEGRLVSYFTGTIFQPRFILCPNHILPIAEITPFSRCVLHRLLVERKEHLTNISL